MYKTEVNTALATTQATMTRSASAISSTDLTINKALISNASGKVAVSRVSDVELGYLSGVGSYIQTQLSNKQGTVTGAASTVTTSSLTTARALISDASGKIAVSPTITSTELACLDGVTSTLQTQVSAIINYGDVKYGSASTKYAGYVNSAGTMLSTFGQYTFTVTANATGDYTINVGTTLSNSNYVIHGSADCGENDCSFSVLSKATTNCRIIIRKQ